MKIAFTGKRAFDVANSAVAFQVMVNDVANRCLIRDEALQDHFCAVGNSPEILLAAFDAGRQTIETVTRDRIDQGATVPFVLEKEDF